MSSNTDILKQRAEILVSASEIFAISSFTSVLEDFPILSGVDPKKWDFVVSIAGVFIAATRLRNLKIDDDREDLLMDIVAKKLNEWDSYGIMAFEDCKSLFGKEYDRLSVLSEYKEDNSFLSSDALGVWIVLNIFDKSPQSEEEIRLVRVIGIMVTHAFFEWWKEEN